jgi:hypothetical protein
VRTIRKLLMVVIVAAVVSFMSTRHHASRTNVDQLDLGFPHRSNSAADPSELPSLDYRCDGRTYCSQMTSCDEAKYFLNHCPNTKMDGDHDGVPCEQQWCKGG